VRVDPAARAEQPLGQLLRDISRLKIAHGCLFVAAMCSAMFTAKAVLPIDGLAATMIISPFCSPLVISSSSKKPVSMPVTPAAVLGLETARRFPAAGRLRSAPRLWVGLRRSSKIAARPCPAGRPTGSPEW
jgi:hypothetical protein